MVQIEEVIEASSQILGSSGFYEPVAALRERTWTGKAMRRIC
jgi:hypothetical protein